MKKDAIILMDTVQSGRVFCSGMNRFETFDSMRMLLEILYADVAAYNKHEPMDYSFLAYPAKAKLATLRLTIYAVDSQGVHGVLHRPAGIKVAFKNSQELIEMVLEVEELVLKHVIQSPQRGYSIIS